jgi:hypothetical protein
MTTQIVTNRLGQFKRRYNCMTGKYDLIPVEPKPDKPDAGQVDRWYVAYLENQNNLLESENNHLRTEIELINIQNAALKSILISKLNEQQG